MAEQRLPDFIIGGAPKCATSSLHFLLGEHPDIGIPDSELHFFDADDPMTHPNFFFVDSGELVRFDPDDRDGPLFRAYADSFTPLGDKKLIGEDSTTYLLSEVAPWRIRRVLPDVRLIFMLRDPVARAYSQYWHFIRSGRGTVSFERALTTERSIILGSTYAPRLARYFELFGRQNVKVILFEDFIANSQRTVDSVAAFLGLEPFTLATSQWCNRSSYPKSLPLELAMNRIRRPLLASQYKDHLRSRGIGDPKIAKFVDRVFRGVSGRFRQHHRAPAMRQATREFLTAHLSQRNRGLSELLQRDLSAVWRGFSS